MGTVIAALLGVVGTIVGGVMNQQEAKRAQGEARQLDEQKTARDTAQTAFSNRLALGDQAISKQRLALEGEGLAEKKRQNVYKMTQDQVAQVEKMLNTNIGLRNLVTQNWGAM